MKKVCIIVGIIILVVIVAVLMIKPKGPDIKQYQNLLNPAISEKADQNMLVVEGKGDPSVVAGKAIALLYKTYYSLKGVPKSFQMVAPRSRWPVAEDTPKNQWLGQFGIPIPETVNSLPEIKNPGDLKVSITKWPYGTVAEILHKGPYATEKETVRRLTNYVTEQGYTIVGTHEEEYLKGPGMFGPGNPDKYLTIIRYQVKKTGN